MVENLRHEQKIIRRKFSRAAGSYDQYARVQYQCAQLLAQRLPIGIQPRTILEIGCGTGNYTQILRQLFPKAKITALDFSSTMINEAKAKISDQKTTFICAEAENFLGSHTDTYDLITSNATLQWFRNLGQVFANCARLLAQDGSVHVSTFGPKTMQDLARACQDVVDPSIQISAANFSTAGNLQELAKLCFGNVKLEEKIIQREYNSIIDMLRHIQRTGVGGNLQPTPRFTPSSLRQLGAWFTTNQGSFHLNYQILFMNAQKSA